MTGVASSQDHASARNVVARNALIILLAQVLGMPLSMLTNIVMGRMLGPSEYGQYYILTTYATLAFLFVDWGLGTTMPARIAGDRSQGGRYLGSVMAWTVITSVFALLIMTTIFYWRGESKEFLLGLILVCAAQALALTVKNAGDAVRGLERTDVAAYSQLGTQLLTALLVIPALLWWHDLHACLLAIALASLLMLTVVLPLSSRAGITTWHFDFSTLRELLRHGSSFLVLNLVIYLQPAIDAYFLNQYASQESIGWLAAARRLINPLLFPAGAMIGALYPTLCRLWTQDQEEFARTTRASLRVAVQITVLLAMGCVLFANVGMLLFNANSYGPAENNLRILGGYVLLLYISMVLGTCINAAGKQRAWAAVQSLCLIVSLVLDPLLIPWFQKHMNNGGLAVNLVTVSSELLMLLAGILLMPRGILNRVLLGSVGRALLAGAAMTLVAILVWRWSEWLAIPLSVATYGAVLWTLGEIDKSQLLMFRSIFKRST